MTDLSPALAVLAKATAEVERVEKPWGYELVFALTEHYCGKVLVIRKGEQLSLQYHREKDETIYVYAGSIELEVGEPEGPLESRVAQPGEAFRLRPGVVHRWRALEDAVVLESSTPHLDDVVRLEDNYGRADTSN